ncbi:putative ORFan [Cotonvirus japonicus]|uniref:ORFan n=1 Tax=Cotonvirus japonicus TaxID=2811091 RepID=A0ABM7NT14_9VIRU|nr:putative ORFan [Cotonvirus japonicus]BCS83293.1 putative ORFan [Cotonvirus japonicus]
MFTASVPIHAPYFVFGGFIGFVTGYFISKCGGLTFETYRSQFGSRPGEGVFCTGAFTFLGALLGFGYGLGKIVSGTY